MGLIDQVDPQAMSVAGTLIDKMAPAVKRQCHQTPEPNNAVVVGGGDPTSHPADDSM